MAQPGSKEAQLRPTLPATPDINSAAALRAQYAIETPKMPRRRPKKLTRSEVEEEPLVDTTTALPLNSKKTGRMQKRQNKKTLEAAIKPADMALLDLPAEIVAEVLGYLRASDVFRLTRVSHSMRDFINENEKAISNDLIRRRYWILYRCFPLPVPFKDVPAEFHDDLLNGRRQELLHIHRKSYHQHVEMVDPYSVCTCMTCVFAWNNLCLLVDLHHWQDNLANREPIPMIPRGTQPQWNQDLLKRNADVVRLAMSQPLYYTAILEKHLATITGTILRFSQWKKRGATPSKPRLYHLTDWDVASGTDEFLDRSGPPSYDFPFHRDNYYSIEAYLPNRKFGVDGKWYYYALPPASHERDLEWTRGMMQSSVSREERERKALANLKEHNVKWSQYLESKQSV
ncbi:hypothetical protein H2198_007119 [Neophaeococcomyces mojaviensis]|uniref:Uncharacterized protein n=1 Tax=Neophaeococcomyces mojaviensis TaxID=3383035 RepID=A0ACC3A104_9EURO|nr:hypothetical protein H2198_007119 [Knufia sp. JES_112]